MILVKISSLAKAILQICHLKARYSSAFSSGFSFVILLLFTSALLTGCGSSKHIQTIPVETIKEITKTDTIYINNVQFDSIYVSRNHIEKGTIIHSPCKGETEGVLIRQHDVEYHYKLLRDTIYKTKIETVHDSIPYKVRITEVKEVKNIPPWIKCLAWTGAISLTLLLIYIFTKLKRF